MPPCLLGEAVLDRITFSGFHPAGELKPQLDESPAQRVPGNPQAAGGLNGSYFLNATTVHDDGARDSLDGDTSGLDWFFATLGPGGVVDHITDLNNGGAEQVD